MSVTVDEILNAARAGVAALTGETSGYLVLGAADRLSDAAGRLESSAVLLGEDGTVAAGRLGVGSAAELEADLRALLAQMLSFARQGVPALLRVSRPSEARGLARLVGEIEAALIPVNRAAARRALSRLHRDVGRAKATGKLGVVEPEPHPSPAVPVWVVPVASAAPIVHEDVDPLICSVDVVVPSALTLPELVVPELIVPPLLLRASPPPAAAPAATFAAPPPPELPANLLERADSFTERLPPAELVSASERAKVEPIASVPHRHPSSPEAIFADSPPPAFEGSHFVAAPPRRAFGSPPAMPVPEEPERTPIVEELEVEAFGAPPIEIVLSLADVFDAEVYEPEATPFLGSWPVVPSVVTPRTVEWPSASDNDTERLPPVQFEAPDELDMEGEAAVLDSSEAIGAALEAIDAAFAARSALEAIELGTAVEVAPIGPAIEVPAAPGIVSEPLEVAAVDEIVPEAIAAIEVVAEAMADVEVVAEAELAPEAIAAASIPANVPEFEAIESSFFVEAPAIDVSSHPRRRGWPTVEVVPEAGAIALEVIDAPSMVESEPEAIELGMAVELALAAEYAPAPAPALAASGSETVVAEVAREAIEIVPEAVPEAVEIVPEAVPEAVEIVSEPFAAEGMQIAAPFEIAMAEIVAEAIEAASTIEVPANALGGDAVEVVEAGAIESRSVIDEAIARNADVALEVIDAAFAAQSEPDVVELDLAVEHALAVTTAPVLPDVAPAGIEVLPSAPGVDAIKLAEALAAIEALESAFEVQGAPVEAMFECDAEPLDPLAEAASPLPPVIPRDEPQRPLECSALPLDLAFPAVPPEEAPTQSPPPVNYKPRRSEVSELLAGFGVLESQSLRDISSELKRMADATGTPCPPAVVARLPKKTATR